MPMRLSVALLACFCLSEFASAQDPAPAFSYVGWFPRPADQQMPTLLPPVRTNESTPATDCKPCDEQAAKNFDRNRLYLPETNPGTRQAPCPCLPLGKLWLDASYLYGTTKQDSGDSHREFNSGLKVNLGGWLDRCQNIGVQGELFFLGNSETTQAVALPGGAVAFVRDKAALSGAEADYRTNLFCEDNRRTDLLIGYRYLHIGETLSDGPAFLKAENDLQLAQVGWAGEFRSGNWYADLTGKIGLGVNVGTVDGTFGGVGGIGGRNKFVAVPEANAKFGYQCSDFLRAFVGYQFLYANEVVRPRSLLRGAANGDPRATTDFWMQAIQVGMEARF